MHAEEELGPLMDLAGPQPPGEPLLRRRRLSARPLRCSLPGLGGARLSRARVGAAGRAGRREARRLHGPTAGVVDGEGRGELGAVDERHRGRGIGRALHVAMFRVLVERGSLVHRGILSARNRPIVRLHERLGFTLDRPRGLAPQVVPGMSAHRLRTRIPFNRPSPAGNELDYVAEAIESGHLSGDGPMARRCQEAVERGARGRNRVPDAVRHACSGDGRAAPGHTAGRRGGLPLVHPSIDRQRLRDARSTSALLRHPPGHPQPRRARRWRSASASGPPRSSARTTPGSPASSTSCSRSASGAGSELVEDNAHGLFGSYRGPPARVGRPLRRSQLP